MPRLIRLVNAVRHLTGATRLDRELDEELRSYVDELTARHVARGLTPAAARRAALVEVGGVEQTKERVRDVRAGVVFETMLRDLRYGCRSLGRSPGFALVVVATLAVGIGANVTMFSVMHAVLWKPLPYPEPDRLIVVEAQMKGVTDTGLSPGELQDLRVQSRTLRQVASIDGMYAHLDFDGEVERLSAARVYDDLLPALGAMPALGRPLRGEQDVVGTSIRGVLISDDLWRRRFDADPGVIGRRIHVNNLDVEVVGVLQPGFRLFMPRESFAAEQIDIWLPRRTGAVRVFRDSMTIARLGPGISLAQAQAELETLAAGLVRAHREVYPDGMLHLSARPLQDVVTRQAWPALVALSAAVALVLMIACVNIANLMFARSGARQRELAVRRALGATRRRIVWQLFAENAVLASLGGMAGLALAHWGVTLVDWLRPTHLPRHSQIGVDGTAALFTVSLLGVVCLLVGLLPVLRISRAREHEPLKSGRTESAVPAMRRLQRALVVAEVALSIVPLVAGGLMIRTFWNLSQAPIGFDPSELLTARFSMSFEQFPDADSRWALHRDAIDRVRRVPGVDAVSAADPLPLARVQYTRRVGRADEPGAGQVLAALQAVVPGYLGITRMALREGRDLTDDDNRYKRDVAIIDERLARQLWPEGAIGGHLAIQGGDRTYALEIVGIVGAVRTTSVRDTEVSPIMVPYHQVRNEMRLVIRTTRTAADIGPEIRQALEPLGTRRAVTEIRPMRELVTDSLGETRFTTLVLTGFAATALLLAAIGLYGTLAYLTAQRTQEFGVRLALGASRLDVLQLVAREGALLTTIGAALGLAGATAIAGLLRGLLYEVTPLDGPTLIGVTALVTLVAMIAAGQPAWRAAKVQAVVALRCE